jgi:Asp-tRNA(Asn)/Glu-tRNA(Gln) amidotransferase A subunit family amidase
MVVDTTSFQVLETTIGDVHYALESGHLSCRQLVEMYLRRIDSYDQRGPQLNSIITLNPAALSEAERLDSEYDMTKRLRPLHGIPIVVKDQIDAEGMPTTLGSVVFKDFHPDRDAFVIERLKEAGVIVMGKATLGELGGKDTHGTLFGSTRNPYALDRTVGGSSGGSAAAVSANLAMLGVGQEGFASIRRPSAWASIVGMRPTAGLVSRSGVYSGWPEKVGTVGPMARTVADLARLLDGMVGYDPDDPLTAVGYGHVPDSFVRFLDRDGLKGARIGVLRESIGHLSEPDSPDFTQVTEVFDRAVAELQRAHAGVIDPIKIPRLRELMAKRSVDSAIRDEAFARYFGRSTNPPFKSRHELMESPDFVRLSRNAQSMLLAPAIRTEYLEYLAARDELMVHLLKTMADNALDAIVHKSVEHQPTFIRDAYVPPYVSSKGAPTINTFLTFVPSITVPAGFTRDGLPAGVTFLGRPFDEGTLIRLAYSYEQATHHRQPPTSAPPLEQDVGDVS